MVRIHHARAEIYHYTTPRDFCQAFFIRQIHQNYPETLVQFAILQ